MPNKKNKIIIIIGPTASGKSALAVQVAQKFNGEIISADSRQVYKGLDIGSGKITIKEKLGIKHYLLDVISPKKVFTASLFKTQAKKALKEIISKNKIPIIAGGTGFYLDTILYDLDLPKVEPNKDLRQKLSSRPTTELFKMLRKLDARRAKTIDNSNRPRLIRAIEIATELGQVPILKQKINPQYDFLIIGIKTSPISLSQKINQRLDTRLRQGLITEVKSLRQNKVSEQRLYDLGLEYRYVLAYLKKEITKEEMKTILAQEINKYAKRQLTWFKRYKQTHWLNQPNEAFTLVKKFLK